MRWKSTDEVPAGTVVVGVDGSDQATAAISWAAIQATCEGRPLVLVHAASLPSPNWLGHGDMSTPDFETAVREGADSMLADAEDWAKKASPDLEVHRLLLVEDPRNVLFRLSERSACIVVGSRGRGPVRSLLLGSVGVALVRHAHCPVVVTRPTKREPDLGVVVGINARAETPRTLEFAYQQAASRQLPLTVVHVVADTPAAVPAAYVDIAPTNREMEEHRRMTAELISGMREQHPDVDVRTEVGHGHPQHVLTTLGDRSELLVVGAHEPGLGELGLTTSIVEHAHCPVAVVPASDG